MKNNNHQQITDTREPPLCAMLSQRPDALAIRLENGAAGFASLASTFSEAEWQTSLRRDGRKIGATVHHVASMYPTEIQLANLLAAGQPISGVTWDAFDTINRDHAIENDNVAKEGAPVSLNSDAPLPWQFFLEDDPERHSYHHLARIKAEFRATSASLAVC